jgi:hypothetical protein
MADTTNNLAEIDERIAIIRENLRELVEQTAAFSGVASEERAAERIGEQEAELERLTALREKLLRTAS